MDLPVNYNDTHFSVRKLVREEYARLQEGKCQHCGELLIEDPSERVQAAYINEKLFPSGFFNWPVHLHHSRVTGLTIGAVHARCNAWLWQYRGE
jgi:hypothetical protein